MYLGPFILNFYVSDCSFPESANPVDATEKIEN